MCLRTRRSALAGVTGMQEKLNGMMVRRVDPTKPGLAAHVGYKSTQFERSDPRPEHAPSRRVRPDPPFANPQNRCISASRGTLWRYGSSASWGKSFGIHHLCAWGATAAIFWSIRTEKPSFGRGCAATRLVQSGAPCSERPVGPGCAYESP